MDRSGLCEWLSAKQLATLAMQKIWARLLAKSRPLAAAGFDVLPTQEHPDTLFYEVLTGICALTSATVPLLAFSGTLSPHLVVRNLEMEGRCRPLQWVWGIFCSYFGTGGWLFYVELPPLGIRRHMPRRMTQTFSENPTTVFLRCKDRNCF